MRYRPIGQLDASVVGLGCNNFGMRIDATQTKLVVDAAIDAGINYFDTAEGYGAGYQYDHDSPENFSGQWCLPEGVAEESFYRPGDFGYEKEVRTRMEKWDALRRERPSGR